MRERLPLFLLTAAAVLCALLFMLVNLRGNLAFALELRAVRLVALVNVAVSIAISAVVFQTVTGNRILTPSIMGLDALYQFGQVALVFALGGAGYVLLSSHVKFGLETLALMALSSALLLPSLKSRTDLGLMLLCGVVIGGLFRALGQLLSRLIDPQEFAVAQGALFADFSSPNTGLLWISSAATIAGCGILWRQRHMLDVVALGQERAVSLGIDWHRTVTRLLLLVSLLVAASTALVGPVTFLGLLVTALAGRLIESHRHATLFAAASLTAIVILVGGQVLLQHALKQSSALSVVIDFVGGITFIYLLFARRSR